MIPPLAVTPPPEPATTPPVRGADRFAGRLTAALTSARRSSHAPADEHGTETSGTRPVSDTDADIDADATTASGHEHDDPAADAPSPLAGAAATGNAVSPSPAAPTGDASCTLGAAAAAIATTFGLGSTAEQQGEAQGMPGDRAAASDGSPAFPSPIAAASIAAQAVASPAVTGQGAIVPAGPAPAGDRGAERIDGADDTRLEPVAALDLGGVAPPAHAVPAGANAAPPPLPAGPAFGRADATSAGASALVALADGTGAPALLDASSPTAADAGQGSAGGTAGAADASGPTHSQTGPTGAVATPATATAPPSTAAPTTPAAGGSAAIAASDAVRFLRELGPARAVQRLAVDLDGAMVAVRLDQTGAAATVRVQVVDDPTGRLDGAWASGVERTLTQSMQRDGAGTHADQRRRERVPLNPDDAPPAARTGDRWARALGDEQ
jgi:hypothetical protein